jgi:hypothetical protein
VIALIFVPVVALLFFALYRRRFVKFGMRFLGASIFLEASDYQAEPRNHVEVTGTSEAQVRLGGDPKFQTVVEKRSWKSGDIDATQ